MLSRDGEKQTGTCVEFSGRKNAGLHKRVNVGGGRYVRYGLRISRLGECVDDGDVTTKTKFVVFQRKSSPVWSIKSFKDYRANLGELRDFILFNAGFPVPSMVPST